VTEPAGPADAVRVSAGGDRVAAEALALEIRRLARQHGLDVAAVRVEAVEATPPPPDSA
jgi:type IV pilus biogenesis protein CpaD/CtpE